MSLITFVVEKTSTGFSAYAEDFENFPVGTTGDHLSGLKKNILEALNLYQEEIKGKAFSLESHKIAFRIAHDLYREALTS